MGVHPKFWQPESRGSVIVTNGVGRPTPEGSMFQVRTTIQSEPLNAVTTVSFDLQVSYSFNPLSSVSVDPTAVVLVERRPTHVDVSSTAEVVRTNVSPMWLATTSEETDPSENQSLGSHEPSRSRSVAPRSQPIDRERDPYSDDDADSHQPVPAVRTGLRIRTTARKSVPLPVRMTLRAPAGDGAGPSRVRGHGGPSSSSSSSSSSGSPPPYRPSSPVPPVARPPPAARPPPVARPSPVPRPPHMTRAPVLCLRGMSPTERQEVARLARGQGIHEHMIDHHDRMIDSLINVAGADSQQLTRVVTLLGHTMDSLHHLYSVVYAVVALVVLLFGWAVWRARF
ncbi:hypothetical protein OSB04_un000025 [Centaurea solstitialis]|uniref:Uncharacterized protein n=1 Tax=Centaurea solstitialis TaxID=347529 RepID=A0AA38SI54_9ASTR|nr:hypothetical protein OSB04_un000025 [Centaurea solstitialis]